MNEKPKPTETADPIADRLAQLDALIEEQKARMAAAPAPSGGLTGSDLKAILDSQKEDKDAQRSVRHSNAEHRRESVFSLPGGDLKNPKVKLTRETFFNNHREHEDELTPAEIEAFNAITHECKARSGAWTAKFKDDGRMLIDVPCHTMDDRMNLPDGLVLILAELSQGERAVSPADMLIEIADLKRRMAAQETGVVLA